VKNAKIIPFFLLLTLAQIATAQRANDKYNRYFTKDQLSFSFVGSHWLATDDVPNPSAFSRGINIQMMYPILGKRSNVAMAIGFGYASQNYYLDQMVQIDNDKVAFTPIPDSISFKKYKINTNYLTLPLELRIRTNPDPHYRRSFKIYPGFRLGALVNFQTKYIGRDLQTQEPIKEKKYYTKHIEKLNYGVSLRVGYGKIMVHGYYSLNQLFDDTFDGSITPIELGLSIVLF
jgi:hypothetical protein